MLLLISHVSIACLSVLYAAFVLVSPSMRKLHINYAMIGLTLITGSVLVIRDHVNILQVCVTGLIYVSIMLFASALIKRRISQKVS